MSDDLIKRSDAIEALNECTDIKGFEYTQMHNALMEIPSADRPQGEWVPFEYGDERWHKCTACGVADRYIEYVERPDGTTGKLVAVRNYCPNCGARMKGACNETD